MVAFRQAVRKVKVEKAPGLEKGQERQQKRGSYFWSIGHTVSNRATMEERMLDEGTFMDSIFPQKGTLTSAPGNESETDLEHDEGLRTVDRLRAERDGPHLPEVAEFHAREIIFITQQVR